LELACIATFNEKTVWIVRIGQLNAARFYSLRPEAARKMLRGAWTTAVRIGIER
jgi:hypothetical protein